MPGDKPVDRRRFFREGLRELLRPLAGAVEPLEEVARQFGQLEAASSRAPGPPARPGVPLKVYVRPPGALPGRDFTDTCSRCGQCVAVCPAECIRIDRTNTLADGAPFIDPVAMPCVLCEGTKCMHVCPTAALRPIPLDEIDMGTAVWRQDLCVRSKGEDCRICVTQCPVGSAAIELVGNDVKVHGDGCAGCGVCEHYCPTSPKSIVVIPRDEREQAVSTNDA